MQNLWKNGTSAATCWKNPANVGAGTVKSAQLTSQTPAPTLPATTQEAAAKKAKQQEKNRKLRQTQKEKKAKKKQEEEEAKRAVEAKSAQSNAHTVSSGSSTEEDSPRRPGPFEARASRVLGAMAKKTLFQNLSELSEDEVAEFGREIDRCYRAKVAVEWMMAMTTAR